MHSNYTMAYITAWHDHGIVNSFLISQAANDRRQVKGNVDKAVRVVIGKPELQAEFID